MADYTEDPAVSVCFSVTIDNQNLGTFTACDGLGLEVTVENKEEGGNNSFIHVLPTRMKFTNIKLTRPINTDSEKVAKWFASMNGTITRTNAEIRAMTLEGKTMATWNLMGVIPVRWQGPSFSLEGAKVATETLELAHHGFIDAAGGN
jgi:phage tail-like protein